MSRTYTLSLECAGCGGSFSSKNPEFANEYCLKCLRRLTLFTPTPEPSEPEPRHCFFCDDELPKYAKKFCDEKCRQWFWNGTDLGDVAWQICIVCTEPFKGHVSRATCSATCAAIERPETPHKGCKRCGGEKPHERRLLCDPCADLQRARFRGC